MTKIMSNQKIKWISISIIISLFQSGLKFYAFSVTNSSSIFTDAVESIANVLASCFALYAVYLTNVPKDHNHPYGHGKIEFFSAAFEGSLISLSGIFVLYHSILAFFSPFEIQSVLQGLVITTISLVLNFFYGNFLIKQGRKLNSITLESDGKHLYYDSITSLIIIIGLLLTKIIGSKFIDPALSVILSFYLIYSGFKIFRKSVAGLMDETNLKVFGEIAIKLNDFRRNSWIDIHNMRIIQFGDRYNIDCHLTLPFYYNLEEAHDEVVKFEDAIKEITNQETEIFTHSDPCIPTCCSICLVDGCIQRKETFINRVVWSVENLQKNQKH